jgi:hypothetical protein
MIVKERDLYTQSVTLSLFSSGLSIGSTTIQYEVRRYVDTRNLGQANSYVVTCTQRFTAPNAATFSPTAGNVSSFTNYPALITNGISHSDPDKIVSDMFLIDYSPKTINTSVTSNQNQSTSSNASNTQQYSSGSSYSQTNSFGASASLGFFGDMPTGDFGLNASRANTSEASQSSSFGSSVDKGSQFSSDTSMALKDWGSYAQLDSSSTWPTWIWGQEYPWDLIDFRNTGGGDDIVLPQYVIDRLYDGTQVYPPSELALFGVSFASKASWLVTLDAGVTDTTSLVFNHALTLCVASHQVQGTTFSASIDTYPEVSHTVTGLDLPVLALDPIGGDAGPALVGFIPGQFTVAPTSSGSDLVIAAESNLMLVRGGGFNGLSQSGFMTTDFSTGAVTLTLYFKVLDPAADVSLSLKHWVEASQAVQLEISVNGGTSITKRVDGLEAGGGGDNVTVIPLRKKDFTSVDFCDLLKLGLNTVTLTFTAEGSGADYTLMAAAVG